MTKNNGTANFLNPENRIKAQQNRKLTLRQKTAIAEYLKTGNKTAAYKSAYAVGKNDAKIRANTFFKRPRIVDALQKALNKAHFDDEYAVDILKKIVEGGMENIDITRPDTSLKALETYFKITNKIGGGNKDAFKETTETKAKKMDVSQLQASLKELDKKQKHILDVLRGVEIEGEIIE